MSAARGVLAITLATLGCSSPELDADQVARNVALAVSDGLPACGSMPGVSSLRHFPSLNRIVDVHVCVGSDGMPVVVSVDAMTSSVVDLTALELDEVTAFKQAHDALDPALRARLEADTGAKMRAHVWFHAAQIESVKEELDASPALMATARLEHEQRVRAGAVALAAKLTSIPGTWNARIPPGQTLRVAALMRSTPTCPTNPGLSTNPCTGNPFPTFGILMFEGSSLLAISLNVNNNYQFIKYTNGAGYDRYWTIRLWLSNWNGLSSSTFGVAWRAGAVD